MREKQRERERDLKERGKSGREDRMGPISTEDLNLRPLAMQAIGDLMRESGEEKMNQLMKSLKEEKVKIEVFKRELPLTMQILSDGE